MFEIREAVYNRDRGIFRVLLDGAVLVGTDHHPETYRDAARAVSRSLRRAGSACRRCLRRVHGRRAGSSRPQTICGSWSKTSQRSSRVSGPRAAGALYRFLWRLSSCASLSSCSSSSSSISSIEIKSFFIAPLMWAIRRSSSSCVPISLRWRTFPFTADAADSAACSACSSALAVSPTKARVREVWVTSPRSISQYWHSRERIIVGTDENRIPGDGVNPG